MVFYLFSLFLLFLPSSNCFDWQDAGNLNWAIGCDFNGGDIGHVTSTGELCGSKCIANADCNRFTWTNYQSGTCWFKSGYKNGVGAVAKVGAVCGYRKDTSGPHGNSSAAGWQVLKNFNLGSIAAVKSEWEVEQHTAGVVNNERQQYVDSDQVLFSRNGHLVVKAYRQNGHYYSGRIHSKQLFTPSETPGKRLRVEFTAKVPTKSGGWPALWMLGGQSDLAYGGWPREGEIDIMEWVNQIGDDIKSALHWTSGNGFAADFPLTRAQISNNFLTYGVEYSNHINDEYVQFYIQKPDGSVMWGPKTMKDTWIYTDFPPCGYQYTAEAKKCSYLAPFDNRMTLIINFAVGGDWGGSGVAEADYNAFESNGVEMEVSKVTVYQATQHYI